MKTTTRALAVVALGVMIASSCVQPDPPGLSLSKLEAKLVFGIDKAPKAGLTPTEASQQLPVFDASGLFVREGRLQVKPYLQPNSDVEACPPAEDPTTVEFGATDNVNTEGPGNRPVPGVYLWRIMVSSGRDLPYDQLTPAGFELRAIRTVKDVPKAQWSPSPQANPNREVFTYEEVRNLSFYELETTSAGKSQRLVERFLISTYLVDTAAERRRASQADLVTQLPSAGHPERGVALLKSITVDGAGAPVAGIDPFEPSNGLTLMGLPFVSGETFTASATDASHGTTVTDQTVVNPRARLNMCGDLMEGFPSVSTQSISTDNTSSPSKAYEVKIWLAPQHGGISIYESTYDETSGVRIVLHRASLYATGPVPADGLPR